MISRLVLSTLADIFARARDYVARADNDFDWSGWAGYEDALGEIDGLLADLRSGTLPNTLTMEVLFAVTGPLQEVSIQSGWSDAFLRLADEFDTAIARVKQTTA